MTQKGKKQFRWKDFNIIEENPEDLTKDKQRVEYGLRLLAHMIARAYLKEQRENKNSQKDIEAKKTHSTIMPNSTQKHQKLDAIKISTYEVTTAIDLPPDRLGFTVKEVAKLLGVGVSSVYKAIETNQIRSVKLGGRVVIPKIGLLEFLHNSGDNEEQKKPYKSNRIACA